MKKGKRLIVVWGIRRSGNHCIRNWCEMQFQPETENWHNMDIDFCLAKFDTPDLNARVIGIEEKHPETTQCMDWTGYDSIHKIIILRDPYNLFASRMKWYKTEERNGGAEFTKLNYLWYADYILNPREDVTPVLYNRFIKEKEYRRELCNKIGGTLDDTALEFVSGKSGGSSFDGTKYERNASEMKTLERWEQFKDNEFYKGLFTDEIKDLSEQIFGVRHF